MYRQHSEADADRRDHLGAAVERGDEPLDSLLLAYDSSLADGDARSAPTIDPALPVEVAERLHRTVELLDLFEQARRSGDISAADFWLASADDDSAARPALDRIGRFEIKRELGRGAYGVVFLADDPLLRRQVALKVPLPEALLTPDLRRRFMLEAQAAAALTHPNLVPVYETGEEWPICYIAAAYCPGQTMAAWLREQAQPIDMRFAATLVSQLADGVAYAHSQGILHRDIKPTNILLEPQAKQSDDATSAVEAACTLALIPKLTDFGLAKIEEYAAGETRTGAILGTPAYMAPEQAAGRLRDIGPATDVYSLGVVLYELLTKRSPFAGECDQDTLRRTLFDEPVAPRKLRPGLAADLDAICLKCLEKEPTSRYPSAQALADDLRRFLAGETTHARPASATFRLMKWSRRRPAAAALVVVTIAAALTILVGSVNYSRRLAIALDATEQHRLQAVDSRNDALEQLDANRQFTYASHMQQAFQGLAHGDISEVDRLLGLYADGNDGEHLRGFEWHHLKRARHGQRMSLAGHRGEVYAVAFSPDDRLLVSGGADGTIRVWDPTTGAEMRTIAAHNSCTNDLGFTPDGAILASASCDHTVKLWDARTWSEIATLQGHDHDVLTVSVAPDGQRIASGDTSGVLRIWRIGCGQPVATLDLAPYRGGINAIEWSPDGALIAVPAGNSLQIFDTTSWQRVSRRWAGDGRSVAFSPDGTSVAVNVGHDIDLWDIEVERLRELHTQTIDRIQKLAFSPDGSHVFYAGSDCLVHRRRIDGAHIGSTTAASSSPFETSREYTFTGHGGRIQDFAISADGRRLATASFDGTVGLWDVHGAGRATPLVDCADPMDWTVPCPYVLTDDLTRLMARNKTGHFVTWDTSAGEVVERPDLPDESWFLCSRDLRRFVAADDKRVVFGSIQGNSATVTATATPGGVREIALSVDGKTAVTAHVDGFYRVWNTVTGETLHARKLSDEFDPNSVSSWANVVLSGDGRLFSNRRSILDLDTGQELELPAGPIASNARFCPGSRFLFFYSHLPAVYVVDVATGQTMRKILLPAAPSLVTCSPDGKTLAVGLRGEIGLWHTSTGQQMGALPLDDLTAQVLDLHFSPDGQKLGAIAIASMDKRAKAAMPERVQAFESADANKSRQTSVYIWQID